MTNELIAAIAADEQRRIADLLAPLTEPERKVLAPRCLELVHALASGANHVLLEDGTFRTFKDSSAWNVQFAQEAAAALAVTGTATFTEIRRAGAWPMTHVHDGFGAIVLLDRRPSWLAKYAEWVLRVADWEPKWHLVYELVRAGAIERPEGPAYLDAALAAGKAARLLDLDPELMWELLAFDGGENSLRTADDGGAGWREAVIARGERQRLLDATLEALASDLSAHRSAWFTGLWRELKPSRQERAARTAALRPLLGAAAPPVIGFAVDELLKAKAEVPPGELTPALTAPAKKTVRGALKLLDASQDGAAVAIALGHEAADIQGEALDRLERWELSNAANDALLRHLDLVAATQRPRVEALLGLALPTDEPEPDAPDVENIAPEIRAALAFGWPVPPAPVPGEPVLGDPIEPIGSFEELADLLLTELYEPTKDERLLDGILRFCDQPFEGPLREKLGNLGTWFYSVATVAAAWCHRRVPDPPSYPHTWEHRLQAAAARAAAGRAGPLLAAPTHHGGWIAPAALIARLTDDPDEVEFAQALLRLAPGGDPALAAHVKGRPGQLLRCALGGDPAKRDGPAAAAARAVAGLDEYRVRVAIVDSDRLIERLVVTREPSGELAEPPSGFLRRFRRERPPGPLAEHLTVAAPADDRERYGPTPDARAWPARREIVCAGAIARIAANLGDVQINMETGAPALLELLIDSRQPLPPLALRLATLALGSNVEREHLLAVDLLVTAIEDGRADAPGLAPGLEQDLAAGLLMTNRVGARLATLAAAGPLQRAEVRELLDHTAHALAPLPTRTYAALLVPFDELCAQTNTGPRRAREFLQTITGASKAAKAARSLLARDGEPQPSERALALHARVARARRWNDV